MQEQTITELFEEFLDLEINNHIQNFRNEHKKEFAVIFEIVDIFKFIKNFFVGKTIAKNDIFLISAIIQLDKLFQSAVLLYERGLPDSADIIIRSIIELSLNITDAVNNENHTEQIMNKEDYERNQTLRIINDYEMFQILPSEFNNDTAITNKNSACFKSARKMAEDNNLKQEYLLYRTYSSNTHVSASVLSNNFEITSAGVNFDNSIQINNFKDNISLLISVTIKPIEVFVSKFCDEEILKNKFCRLCGNYMAAFRE